MDLKELDIPDGMRLTEYQHFPFDKYTDRKIVRISPDWNYFLKKLKDAYKKNFSEHITDYSDDARVAY